VQSFEQAVQNYWFWIEYANIARSVCRWCDKSVWYWHFVWL